jgi:hypothetical protein
LDEGFSTSGKQLASSPSNQLEFASTYGEGTTIAYKGKMRVWSNVATISVSCVLRNCIIHTSSNERFCCIEEPTFGDYVKLHTMNVIKMPFDKNRIRTWEISWEFTPREELHMPKQHQNNCKKPKHRCPIHCSSCKVLMVKLS